MRKQIILVILTALFANFSAAQNLNDKIYFDEDWNVITDATKAAFYRLYDANDKSEGRKPYKDFYISGKLQGEGNFVWRNGEMEEDGEQKSYYPGGQIESKWYQKGDEIDGERVTYYENGNIKEHEFYVNGIPEGSHKEYDSTGDLHRVYNYKNGLLDGKQIQYLSGKIDLEDYFDNGLMQKEIRYSDGKIRRIFTLVSRQDTTFIANDTWFLREDEDSLIRKKSVDKIYDFDPSIWEYPFQMHFVDLSDFTYDEAQHFAGYGAISDMHGKFQEFDRQDRIVKEGQYSLNNKVGIWKYYDYNQNCYYTIDYDNKDEVTHYYTIDNKPFSGKFIHYENDGAQIELNIENGIHRGKYTVYHYDDEGEVIGKYYGNFDDDGKEDGYFHAEMFLDGEWKTVDFSNYKHGVKHGEWRTIANDSIIFKNYNNGELDGEFQICAVNLREDYAKDKDSLFLLTSGTYHNGKKTGHWWRLTDNSYKLRYEEGNYLDDSKNGEWHIYNGYYKANEDYTFGDKVTYLQYVVNYQNGLRHGSFVEYDTKNNKITQGQYSANEMSSEWIYTYYDEKCYKVINYDNDATPIRLYTLSGKPFSGKHIETYEKDEDYGYDTVVYSIKKSYIQHVEFIDSKTSKVIEIVEFKNGLPIEK